MIMRRIPPCPSKTLSPRPTFRSSRDKWGMGGRHALFPGPALDALPFGGCRIPDAILHGKRSFGLVAGPSSAFSDAEFRVRLFSSLQLVVAATGLRTRSRHACDFLSRLNRLAPGQPPFLTVRSPEATGLASSLIDCIFSQSSGAVFNIASLLEVFHAACLAVVTFPSRALFCPPFSVFLSVNPA